MQSDSKEEEFRGVAQLASASGLGPEGPVFESQYPDNKETVNRRSLCCFQLCLLQHCHYLAVDILCRKAEFLVEHLIRS